MPLATLERWFDGHVTGRFEGRRVPSPDAEEVILPNTQLSSAERVDIYTRAYFARLLEVLQADYPALEKILGSHAFEHVAADYLRKHPSKSWSLNGLGRKLPAFLDKAPRIPKRAIAADVARVECAMSEAFDAEEAAPLSPEAVAAVPPEKWGGARLVPVPSFRLLALRTRANATVTAARNDQKLPPQGAHATWCVVYRKDYRVFRLDLAKTQHALLDALSRGKTFSAALQAAMKAATKRERAELPSQVFGWFRTWTEEGLFQSVRVR